MRKRMMSLLCLGVALGGSSLGCGGEPASPAEDAAAEVYRGALTLANAKAKCQCELEIVRVSGRVFNFGVDLSATPPAPFPFQSVVPGTKVWIAEVPLTRSLNLHANAEGDWSLPLVKLKGRSVGISFVYEQTGYETMKSQVFDVADSDLSDIAAQFPTQAYYTVAKGQIEQQLGALLGAPYTLTNILVTTVGKSWASMFSPALPHGDPGALVTTTPTIAFPASVGPVYFNESVSPDPTLSSTSVDGGVLFGNLARGAHSFTATKAPFSYTTVKFVVEAGINLYVASPPHGIQGTNTSPPGQP